MKKKGISPLIATVLLIGFTVALVLVVTTWGTDYLRDILGSTERTTGIALRCSPPYLEFSVNVDCENNKITIMNRGTETIVKLKVIPYPDVDDSYEIEKELVSGDVTSEDLPEAIKLEIVAYILFNNEEIPCAQAAREITVDCQ